MRMRIAPTAVLALLALLCAPALAASTEDARQAVQRLEREAIAMASPSMPMAQKEQRFRQMLHRDFDMPAVARFVLGRQWRTASPDQKQEFLQLFEDSTVHTWTRRFDEYGGERLQVGQARSSPAGGFEVDSQIIRPTRPPLPVAWRLTPDLKVTDIIVEGVSMALTYRQEYASVMRSGGVDGLLSALRNQVASAR